MKKIDKNKIKLEKFNYEMDENQDSCNSNPVKKPLLTIPIVHSVSSGKIESKLGTPKPLTSKDDNTKKSLLKNKKKHLNTIKNFLKKPEIKHDIKLTITPPNDAINIEIENTFKSSRIVINVSGTRYEIDTDILSKYPTTLLGNPEKLYRYYDIVNDEFFFDRNNSNFDAILYYYQSNKKLYRPLNVPVDIFIEECTFYKLDKDLIDTFRRPENVNQRKEAKLPDKKILKMLWLLFEFPESSIFARILALFSMIIIIISIVIFCMETLPSFRNYEVQYHDNSNTSAPLVNSSFSNYAIMNNLNKYQFVYKNFTNSSNVQNFNKTNSTDFYLNNHVITDRYKNKPFIRPLFIVESICVAWFTIELIIRLVASPSKWEFSKDIMNIVDLISIIPFFITLSSMILSHFKINSVTDLNLSQNLTNFTNTNYMVNNQSHVKIKSRQSQSFAILRVIRLVRVFRIFKLSRHSKGLQVLGQTLKASVNELCLLVFFLFIGVILYSSAIYFAEINTKNTHFTSIPSSFWWAVVTMTTVGYGDMIPISSLGKIIGSLCAITGVLTIALPVPVIVSNFNYYYHRDNESNNQTENTHQHVMSCPTFYKKRMNLKI
ncbi:Potassium voltage-gated channel subfamily A member 5 [Intoshia linei]|uniref:Potassium voltage-gated channel subfamily A member 5 n=1 Tax=Intoshia linei TaxID=1819745 RepID=A0A177B1N1_9BILA|nr:Potassium voltage-gated channel subfamily A member 5 [Intoshia linei]